MVKMLKQLVPPLALALGVLVGLGFLVKPAGVTANTVEVGVGQPPAEEPAAQISEQAIVLAGSDFRISTGNSARLPEIAANNTFAAAVYLQGGQIFLRSAQKGSGWGFNTLVAASGTVPKLAFKTGSTNTLYIVWQETLAIRFRECTLGDPGNTCKAPVSIAASPATSPDRLRTPDIAVGGSRVFVTWIDRQTTSQFDNIIRLAFSNNGINWTIGSQNLILEAGDSAGSPSLAATASHVHLAYKDGSSPSWKIVYRRLLPTLALDGPPDIFASGSAVNSSAYGAMNNPAIAVNGPQNKVYLLWDNKHTSPTFYGLTGVQSTNNGTSWGTAVHIPSQASASLTNNVADRKKSKDSGPPVEEATLLPSLTISATGFAAVWQQRPQEQCQSEGGAPLNDTSEIFFTPNTASAAAAWGMLANNRLDYSIDPDVAVDTNGTHVIFMKDASVPNCGTGGESGEYVIYYRGPFNKDSDRIKRMLMPILRKSN